MDLPTQTAMHGSCNDSAVAVEVGTTGAGAWQDLTQVAMAGDGTASAEAAPATSTEVCASSAPTADDPVRNTTDDAHETGVAHAETVDDPGAAAPTTTLQSVNPCEVLLPQPAVQPQPTLDAQHDAHESTTTTASEEEIGAPDSRDATTAVTAGQGTEGSHSDAGDGDRLGGENGDSGGEQQGEHVHTDRSENTVAGNVAGDITTEEPIAAKGEREHTDTNKDADDGGADTAVAVVAGASGEERTETVVVPAAAVGCADTDKMMADEAPVGGLASDGAAQTNSEAVATGERVESAPVMTVVPPAAAAQQQTSQHSSHDTDSSHRPLARTGPENRNNSGLEQQLTPHQPCGPDTVDTGAPTPAHPSDNLDTTNESGTPENAPSPVAVEAVTMTPPGSSTPTEAPVVPAPGGHGDPNSNERPSQTCAVADTGSHPAAAAVDDMMADIGALLGDLNSQDFACTQPSQPSASEHSAAAGATGSEDTQCRGVKRPSEQPSAEDASKRAHVEAPSPCPCELCGQCMDKLQTLIQRLNDANAQLRNAQGIMASARAPQPQLQQGPRYRQPYLSS